MNQKEAKLCADSILRDFEHPRGGVEERIELDIRRHRRGWGRFVLTRADGTPVSGAKISLKQKKHAFQFGCNLFKLHDFETEKKNAAYEKMFKKVFNIATVPFYWDTLEPEQGKPRFSVNSPKISRRPATDDAVSWCLENGIRPKGHWLFCDNFVPAWLPKNGRDLMILLEQRIAQLAERYGGKVTVWDVVNEAFSNMRRFHPTINWSVTPQDYVFRVFKLAEKYFPDYTELVYNDGEDIAFERFVRDNSPLSLLCRELQRRGVRLGGLGMQFHMMGQPEKFAENTPAHRVFYDPKRLFDAFDQYSLLGIPLHMTEISFSTFPAFPRKLAEEHQMKTLRYFYRLWFSCPAMESIIYWNFVDKTAYGSESDYDACLLSKDLTPKPAFDMLDELVNHEWHTEESVETDERGIADWNGFYGDYDAEIRIGRTKIKQTVLLRKDGENEIRMHI